MGAPRRLLPVSVRIVLGLLCTLIASTPGRADERRVAAVAAPTAPPITARELGRPARSEAVEEALAMPGLREDVIAQYAVVEALAEAGGVEAARGLVALLPGAQPGMRLHVWKAVVRVGLRTEALAREARRDAESYVRPLRHAAVNALGVVGDGRDLVALLAWAGPEEGDPRLRAAALRALRRLSGLDLPYDHGRWAVWHREVALGARPDLMRALEELERGDGEGGAGPADHLHRLRLAHLGWVELPAVRRELDAWLAAGDARLVAAACGIATALRMADLSAPLQHACTWHQSGVAREALDVALRSLGVAEADDAGR